MRILLLFHYEMKTPGNILHLNARPRINPGYVGRTWYCIQSSSSCTPYRQGCMRDLADMRIYTHIWELLLMRRHGFVFFKLKIVSERPITEAKEAVSTS